MSSSHEPETRKLSDLRENPKSVEIYGADDISDLLESIPREGVLEPLVIKPDGTILSGHRRFRAAKQLVGEGRVESDVVPCRVVDVRDETEEKGLIIQFNRQRKKTFEQMMKEAQVLEAVEKTRAEERQRSGLLLGERRKLPSASGEANGPRQGKAAEAVAGEIGVSRATYERGKKVWDAAKQGDPTAQQLVGKLNRGEVTVSDAYQRVRSEEKQREKRAEMDRVRAAPILPSEGTLLGDCREEMKKLGDGSVALILTDVPFFITAEMAVHRLVNPMKFDPGLAQAQEDTEGIRRVREPGGVLRADEGVDDGGGQGPQTGRAPSFLRGQAQDHRIREDRGIARVGREAADLLARFEPRAQRRQEGLHERGDVHDMVHETG